MLSLRTTAVSQQPTNCAEATVTSQPTDQLVWGEAETTPWEGLHFRSAR